MAARLVEPTLFGEGTGEVPGQPAVLLGSRCPDCATTVFPNQSMCPSCGSDEMAEVSLPERGELWGFTVQSFRPKPPYCGPDPFEPFGVGYVDLGDVVVESRLTNNDTNVLQKVSSVRSVLIKAFDDADGTAVLTYAFAPVEDERHDDE